MWFLLLLALLVLALVGISMYGTYIYEVVCLGDLRLYLRTGQWKEACEETEKLLGIYLRRPSPEEIQSFPCDRLQAIDRAWKKYSDGYFGFSVQASIYKSVSLNPSERKEIEYLGRLTNWTVEHLKVREDLGWSYRYYYESIYRENDCHYASVDPNKLSFSRFNVPRGHLPIFVSDWTLQCNEMVDWWERILSCNSGRG